MVEQVVVLFRLQFGSLFANYMADDLVKNMKTVSSGDL